MMDKINNKFYGIRLYMCRALYDRHATPRITINATDEESKSIFYAIGYNDIKLLRVIPIEEVLEDLEEDEKFTEFLREYAMGKIRKLIDAHLVELPSDMDEL